MSEPERSFPEHGMTEPPTQQLDQRYWQLCRNLGEANHLLEICHTDCVELLRRAVLRRDASLLSRVLMDCSNCPGRRGK